MTLNDLLCADVPLRKYSLAHFAWSNYNCNFLLKWCCTRIHINHSTCVYRYCLWCSVLFT